MGFSDAGIYDYLAVSLAGSRVNFSKGLSWQVLGREDSERKRRFTENQKGEYGIGGHFPKRFKDKPLKYSS